MGLLVSATARFNRVRHLSFRSRPKFGRIIVGGEANSARQGTTRQRVTFAFRTNSNRANTNGTRRFFFGVNEGQYIVNVLGIVAMGKRYQSTFLTIDYRDHYRMGDTKAFDTIGTPGNFQTN